MKRKEEHFFVALPGMRLRNDDKSFDGYFKVNIECFKK